MVVPIIRTIVFWNLYWSPLILENYNLQLIEANEEGLFEGQYAGDDWENP